MPQDRLRLNPINCCVEGYSLDNEQLQCRQTDVSRSRGVGRESPVFALHANTSIP